VWFLSVQRIFKCSDIPNASLAQDKQLNILIYMEHFCASSYAGVVDFLKIVPVFGPSCIDRVKRVVQIQNCGIVNM